MTNDHETNEFTEVTGGDEKTYPLKNPGDALEGLLLAVGASEKYKGGSVYTLDCGKALGVQEIFGSTVLDKKIKLGLDSGQIIPNQTWLKIVFIGLKMNPKKVAYKDYQVFFKNSPPTRVTEEKIQ